MDVVMIFGQHPQIRTFTPTEISEHCEVSEATARRWLRRQKFPRLAKKHLDLVAANKIIPLKVPLTIDELERVWTGTGFYYTPEMLQQLTFLMDQQRKTEFHNMRLHQYIDYLEKVIPKAPVIKFDRDRCRVSATDGMEMNDLFQKPSRERF